MKKLSVRIAAATIIVSQIFSVAAFGQSHPPNYTFNTGPDYRDKLGRPTQTDIIPRNPQLENIRRNKDAALIPPPFGLFSGEFPTGPSNIYITPDRYQYARNTTTTLGAQTYDTLSFGVNGLVSDSGVLPPTSVSGSVPVPTGAQGSGPISNVTITETPASSSRPQRSTESIPYADGSIGTLSISKLNLSVKVYEGETLENMARGAAHFEFTSNWDGNVGLAAHNSGSAGFFEGLKRLNTGDEVIYETKYGTRRYAVVSQEHIAENDYSALGWSSDNRLTMITCVSGAASQRLVVVAVEV